MQAQSTSRVETELVRALAERADEFNALAEPADMVSTDAMIAAAAHVQREYGCSGYSIGVVARAGWFGDGVFQVVASDGARFRLYADRWGNVERIPEARAC